MTSLNNDALVIDAGVGLMLCTPNERRSELSGAIENLLAVGTQLWAPTLWAFEITSILTKAIHFGQMSEPAARAALGLCLELAVELVQPDDELTTRALNWTLRLNRAAAYDSFYLALAERLGCQLWTADRRLANVVQAPWVRFVGTNS
jgi:predicted nucleic acid-binding protein